MANLTKSHITPAPAGGYAAFYYMWKNTTTNKMYGGKHKGYVNDGYHHSSQNPKMIDDFQNMKHQWEYFVTFYGTLDEVSNYERKELKTGDASKSDLWYNLTNGGDAYSASKNQLISSICTDIASDIWLQDDELDIEGIQKLIDNGIQVRINASDPSFTKTIETLIDDKGDTSNTNPLILIEDSNGLCRLINGSTTAQATIDSKHGTKLKYKVIPWSRVSTFNDSDRRALGLALNPKPEKPTSPTNTPDAVMYVMEAYRNLNRPIKDESNREYICDILKFNSKEYKSVINEAIAQIDQGASLQLVPLIRYSQKSNKHKTKAKVEVLQSKLSKTKWFCFSSSIIRYEDILKELVANEGRGNSNVQKFGNIGILVHFASYRDISSWNKRGNTVADNVMKSLLDHYQIGWVNFEFMDKY